MDAVYSTLRRIASGYLRHERSEHTLQPTALVNEAYLKLFGHSEVQFVDRAHFFAVVSQAMRRILVDHARMKAAARRQGEHVPLDTMIQLEMDSSFEPTDLLNLDLALESLAREKPSLARVIEMRYFGGMTAEETAEVLGCSVHVVRHELRIAHASGDAPAGRARRAWIMPGGSESSAIRTTIVGDALQLVDRH